MNYREKIQNMINQINQLYDDAGSLRDMASQQEKEHWNKFRGIFYDAAAPLRKLDNSLSDNRAKICVCETEKVRIYIPCSECGSEQLQNVRKCKHCGECYGADHVLCQQCE